MTGEMKKIGQLFEGCVIFIPEETESYYRMSWKGKKFAIPRGVLGVKSSEDLVAEISAHFKSPEGVS